MIDFRPLCVPPLPRSRIRSMPHGKSTSSISTIKSAGVALVLLEQHPNRNAAQIHHRLRLRENYFLARELAAPHVAISLPAA